MKPTKILVPVDGSITSKNAAKYAAHMGGESEIILLHAYGSVSQLLTGDGLALVKKELEEKSEELLKEYAGILGECGASYTTMIKEGNACNVILTVAEEENCDLIVMGSRGLTGIESTLMGSIANKVVQSAHCPVLITRNLRKQYPDHACFV